MLEHTRIFVRDLDKLKPDLRETLRVLRYLTLDEFGEILLSLPNEHLPHLSQILPTMASAGVQKTWTGASGLDLLAQSCSAMNFLAANYVATTGPPFSNIRTLDFGCGWGRLLRLLLYFSDPDFISGCDAWETSLGFAREHGILGELKKSEVVPDRLPFPDGTFDLIFAFSIFTHLSEVATIACLRAIRKAINPSGLAVITIRPREVWTSIAANGTIQDHSGHLREHDEAGFAFSPTAKPGADGIVHFGNTSISPAYLSSKFPEWKIVKVGRTLPDPLQIFLVMVPVETGWRC